MLPGGLMLSLSFLACQYQKYKPSGLATIASNFYLKFKCFHSIKMMANSAQSTQPSCQHTTLLEVKVELIPYLHGTHPGSFCVKAPLIYFQSSTNSVSSSSSQLSLKFIKSCPSFWKFGQLMAQLKHHRMVQAPLMSRYAAIIPCQTKHILYLALFKAKTLMQDKKHWIILIIVFCIKNLKKINLFPFPLELLLLFFLISFSLSQKYLKPSYATFLFCFPLLSMFQSYFYQIILPQVLSPFPVTEIHPETLIQAKSILLPGDIKGRKKDVFFNYLSPMNYEESKAKFQNLKNKKTEIEWSRLQSLMWPARGYGLCEMRGSIKDLGIRNQGSMVQQCILLLLPKLHHLLYFISFISTFFIIKILSFCTEGKIISLFL
ncbi:putative signal peptide protein [Puccinia sorghi]|uniref:Putative signal peptide protein n=1 Tax=Puccinia sorghi TaxID=27349 RepID=A0A0L6VM56_9BASI|nr:putative signal peptide protein [Puccinia sorghi]